MKDKQRRARQVIVEHGIRRLLKEGPLRRTDIFVPEVDPHLVKDRATYGSEISKKEWQRVVLKRFIDVGFIEEFNEGGQIFYNVKSRGRLNEILRDHEDNGLSLIWFVFPNEAPEGRPPEARVDLPGVEDEKESESPEELAESFAEAEPENKSAKELKKPDTEVIVELKDILTAFLSIGTKLAELLGEFKTDGLAYSKKMDAIEQKLNKVLDHRVDDEKAVKAINGLAKRISDLEERLKQVGIISEATHKTIKDSSQHYEGIKASVDTMVSISGGMEHLSNTVRPLAEAFDAFVGEYKENRKNKLGELSEQLKKHLEAGELLHEALLEVAANEGNEPGETGRIEGKLPAASTKANASSEGRARS